MSASPTLSLKPVSLPEIAGGDALADLRRQAAARFAEAGAPGQRLERWKYTNLGPLSKTAFSVGGEAASPQDLPEIEGCARVIFVDGRLAADLSDTLAGVSALSQLPAEEVAALLTGDTADDQSLATLNTALAGDGLVLRLGKGEALSKPLHIIHVSGGGRAANLRHVIKLDAGASATIIETMLGAEVEYWSNVVTDAHLADGARLTHLKWQRESLSAFHTALTKVRLGANARYEALTLATGGRIMRQEFDIALDGAGADCLLKGVSLGGKGQHLDMTVRMAHVAGNAHSDQKFKSVLAGGARSVFQGMVKVGRGADGTDAHQKSSNLLLDRSAEVDTKPELEIYADDVACSHGATVGELEADKIFYLCQRGLSQEAARALLVEGFVSEIFDGLGDTPAAYLRDGAAEKAAGLTRGEAS